MTPAGILPALPSDKAATLGAPALPVEHVPARGFAPVIGASLARFAMRSPSRPAAASACPKQGSAPRCPDGPRTPLLLQLAVGSTPGLPALAALAPSPFAARDAGPTPGSTFWSHAGLPPAEVAHRSAATPTDPEGLWPHAVSADSPELRTATGQRARAGCSAAPAQAKSAAPDPSDEAPVQAAPVPDTGGSALPTSSPDKNEALTSPTAAGATGPHAGGGAPSPAQVLVPAASPAGPPRAVRVAEPPWPDHRSLDTPDGVGLRPTAGRPSPPHSKRDGQQPAWAADPATGEDPARRFAPQDLAVSTWPASGTAPTASPPGASAASAARAGIQSLRSAASEESGEAPAHAQASLRALHSPDEQPPTRERPNPASHEPAAVAPEQIPGRRFPPTAAAAKTGPGDAPLHAVVVERTERIASAANADRAEAEVSPQRLQRAPDVVVVRTDAPARGPAPGPVETDEPPNPALSSGLVDPSGGEFPPPPHDLGEAATLAHTAARGRSGGPMSAAGAPTAASVAGQVLRGVLSLERPGRHRIELHLEPPELGTVRVDAVVEGRHLAVVIHAEREPARLALEAALGRLAEALTQQGLVPERIAVSGGFGLGTGPGDDRTPRRESPPAAEWGLDREPATVVASAPEGRLDLRV